MPFYYKKPLTVFAMQYTGDNADEITKEFNFPVRLSNNGRLGIGRYGVYANKSDYIIREHNGDIIVIRKEEFDESYEQL